MQAPTKLWMNKHVVAYLYNRKYPVIGGLSCTTLCDPRDCSLPGVSIHGVFHAGILEWVAIPCKGDLPNPGTEAGPHALGADSLLFKPPGKQLLSNKTQAVQRAGFGPWVRKAPTGEGNGDLVPCSCLGRLTVRGAWPATRHGTAGVGHDLVTKPPQ